MNVEVTVEAKSGARHIAQMTTAGPLSIGRGPECDIQLDDNHISRRHLLLHIEPSALRVQDVSSNGTLAGDRLLRGGVAEVAYGTPILLGLHTVYVRALGSMPPPATPVLDTSASALAAVIPPQAPAQLESDSALRREIHKRLLEHLDLATTDAVRLDDPSFRPRVLTALRRIVKLLEHRLPVETERDLLVGELADEALGLGPLEHLLNDPTVSEIMVIDADTSDALHGRRAGAGSDRAHRHAARSPHR
jgi:pilus assembly protein CpaF